MIQRYDINQFVEERGMANRIKALFRIKTTYEEWDILMTIMMTNTIQSALQCIWATRGLRYYEAFDVFEKPIPCDISIDLCNLYGNTRLENLTIAPI